MYEGLEFDNEDDKKGIDIFLQKLRRYCIGETNEIYKRYRINKRDQGPNESLDAYVRALRTLAKTSNFRVLENSLIRDRIVIGVRDNQARKKLLQVSKLTLKECIDICRSYETSSQQLKEINQEEVSAISQSNEKKPREIRCKFCAKTHVWNKLKCPAWGKTCSNCGIPNHFAVACKNKPPPPSSATSSKPPTLRRVLKPVHAVEDSDFDEYVACVDVKEQVCAVENPDRKDKLPAVMLLNGHRVPFQLDTGAMVNILPEESFKEVYGEASLSLLDNADVTLVMYNKTEEKPIGKKRVQVVNPRNGRKYSVEFVVVAGKGKPLLGLRASEQMQLISVVRQNIMAIQSQEPSQSKTPLTAESILKEHADVFRGEGKLEGDLHLEIDPNVPPVQLPTRKVPIAIKEKLKEELDRLEGLNIITPVNVPTSWISTTVVTLKRMEMSDCVWTPSHLTKPLTAITTHCRQSRMSFLSSQMQGALPC